MLKKALAGHNTYSYNKKPGFFKPGFLLYIVLNTLSLVIHILPACIR